MDPASGAGWRIGSLLFGECNVALIRDDDPVPRGKWSMGRILRLVKGPDGHVRGAQLAVLSNFGKRTTVFRPLQKLIPFEIEENYAANESGGTTDESQLDELAQEHECSEDENTSEEHTDVNEDKSGTRCKRKAAIEGEKLRRFCEQYM